MRSIGLEVLLAGALCTALGLWLGWRYGAAIRQEGFTRPYFPWWQKALAFLGDGLVIIGLIIVMIGVMVAFF